MRMVREDLAERATLLGGLQSDPRDLSVDLDPRDPETVEKGVVDHLARCRIGSQSDHDGLRDRLQDVERHAADLYGGLKSDRRSEIAGCHVDALDS